MIPKQCDVVIIGGGPAGSSAATLLAKTGYEVVLLEKTQFPRNQVGESLIPHFWKFTDALGVSAKIQQEAFVEKSGGITAWKGKFAQISFADYGYTRPGLHVERDIFDQLLLHHAQTCGAQVFYEVSVKKVVFSNPQSLALDFVDKHDTKNYCGTLRCAYLIDASGHRSLLANQFETRQIISSEFNFLSLWGYFKNSHYVGVNRRSNAPEMLNRIKPVTFVMSFQHGWIWHIVLREKTSVGLVLHANSVKGMDKQQRETFFKQVCATEPYLSQLLSSATYIEGSLQHRPDYSYYSKRICGENYYCIGDAAAFVDPIFSHGVQNAFYTAGLASLAIQESFKKPTQRVRYSQLCASRMQQFYSFSRALSLGDFGSHGVNRDLVKSFMRTMPLLEMELMLVASQMTDRSDNFKQLAIEAGVWNEFKTRNQTEQPSIAQLDF